MVYLKSREDYERVTKEFRETMFDDDTVKSIKVKMKHRALFLDCCEWKMEFLEAIFSYFEEWCEMTLPLFYCDNYRDKFKKRVYYLIIVLELCYSRNKNEIVEKCQNILIKCLLKNKAFLKNFDTDLVLKSIPEMPENVAQIIVDHILCCSQQRLSNVSMTSKTFSQ